MAEHKSSYDKVANRRCRQHQHTSLTLHPACCGCRPNHGTCGGRLVLSPVAAAATKVLKHMPPKLRSCPICLSQTVAISASINNTAATAIAADAAAIAPAANLWRHCCHRASRQIVTAVQAVSLALMAAPPKPRHVPCQTAPSPQPCRGRRSRRELSLAPPSPGRRRGRTSCRCLTAPRASAPPPSR